MNQNQIFHALSLCGNGRRHATRERQQYYRGHAYYTRFAAYYASHSPEASYTASPRDFIVVPGAPRVFLSLSLSIYSPRCCKEKSREGIFCLLCCERAQRNALVEQTCRSEDLAG